MADKNVRYIEPDYDTVVALDHEYRNQIRPVLDSIQNKPGLFGAIKMPLIEAASDYAFKHARAGEPWRTEHENGLKAKFAEVHQQRLGNEIIPAINRIADDYIAAVAPQAVVVSAPSQSGAKASGLRR